MNPLVNLLLLVGVPTAFVLAGYWLASGLDRVTAAERLATAAVLGVCVLVWNVALAACFRPLSGVWAWLCLWPIVWSLLRGETRRRLFRDGAATLFTRSGALAAGLLAGLLLLLLWPVLTRPELVYYDGSASHDAFLWIANAEHLKRHTYWEMPVVDPTHPFAYTAGAVVGWRPPWGRFGAEGLLALLSSVVGLAPVKIYVGATAALVVPWIAAVYLVCRTFMVEQLGRWSIGALFALPATFVFFHGNANLPNLFGAIIGAMVVVAVERSLRAPSHRVRWRVMLALAVHGLICCYPEMAPFIALPASMLWLRAAVMPGSADKWHELVLTLVAGLAGLMVNPATTIRAWFGFFGVLTLVQTNNQWANMFGTLRWAHCPAALFSLAVRATKLLGPPAAAVFGIAIIGSLIIGWRRARDRFGALAIVTGGAFMGAYTVWTGFGYGWQKTVQFAAPFIAAYVPVVAVGLPSSGAEDHGVTRWWNRALAAAVLLFFTWATIWNCLEEHKWSRGKAITRDWFDLRSYVREHLMARPIVVEPASFRPSFFHGMWATYFLAEVPLYFARRGEQNGGYLRDAIATESEPSDPEPVAFVISRTWADAFESNSEWLFTSPTVAIVKRSNRVLQLDGVTPEDGVPQATGGRIAITLVPHSASTLALTIEPQTCSERDVRWSVRRVTVGVPQYSMALASPPPWTIKVPLAAGQANEVDLIAEPAPLPLPGVPPAFILRDVRIMSTAP